MPIARCHVVHDILVPAIRYVLDEDGNQVLDPGDPDPVARQEPVPDPITVNGVDARGQWVFKGEHEIDADFAAEQEAIGYLVVHSVDGVAALRCACCATN